MPLNILVKNIDTKINNFSLTAPFDFTVSVNVFAKAEKNVNISGHCTLDLNKMTAYMSDLKIDTDLSQWDLAQVKNVTSLLQNVPVWPQEVKGQVLVQIPQLVAS